MNKEEQKLIELYNQLTPQNRLVWESNLQALLTAQKNAELERKTMSSPEQGEERKSA